MYNKLFLDIAHYIEVILIYVYIYSDQSVSTEANKTSKRRYFSISTGRTYERIPR